jgi:hypothetical protein
MSDYFGHRTPLWRVLVMSFVHSYRAYCIHLRLRRELG